MFHLILFFSKVVLPLAAEAPKAIVLSKNGGRGRGGGRGGGRVQSTTESRSGDIESDEVQNPMQMQTRPRS